MLVFLTRRFFSSAFTLLFLLAITFLLLRLAPGGPFDTDHVFPAEIQANLEARYGLNQPLLVQLGLFFKNLFQGNLGESFQYIGKPVAEIIGSSFPTSLWLGTLALIFATTFGVFLGCLAAWKQNTIWDWGSMFVAVSGISLPSYVVASLLILIFSLGLDWLPPALWEGPEFWILPSITLALRPLAMIARLTRASLLEAMTSDYIRTAYSKGLKAEIVVFKHALRNSLIPVVTLMGPLAAGLVTGSFLVEVVFQIPGIGKYFVSAVLNRDYPLVMGVTLTYGIILIVANLLVDLTYGWIDPRIQISAQKGGHT